MSLINDALKRANQAQKQKPPEREDRPKLAPLQPVENARPGFDWSRLLLPAVLGVVLMAAGAFLWSWATSRHGSGAVTEAAKAPTEVKPVVAPEPTKPAAETATTGKPVIKISTNVVVRTPPPVTKPVEVASAPSAPSATPPATAVAPPAPVAVSKAPEPTPVASSTPAPVQAPVAASAPATTTAVETTPPAATIAPKPTPPSPPPAPPKPEFPQIKIQGIAFRRTNPSVYINGKSWYVGDVVQGAHITKIERLSVFMEFQGETREFSMEP